MPSAIGSGLSIARGRTSPLTEIPMQVIKAADRQKQIAVEKAWREALSNPDLARTVGQIVRAQKGLPAAATKKFHSYILTAILAQPHDEQTR